MKGIAVLLTTFLVGACTATPTKRDVGPKECAKGPEYWCQNIQTAKSCGAVKHCIQEEWEKIKLPKDDTEICDLCKKMVQEARDQLLSNETQEELKEVFEGTCRIYFPIKVLADECIKFVDEFIPELVEMLVSRMDPQTVCATAGLCNAAKFQAKFFARRTGLNIGSPATCQDCKKFGKDIEDMLHSHTKDEIKAQLLKICAQIKEHPEICREIVVNYFDKIYEVIMTQFDPNQMCLLLGFCDDTNNKPEPHMTSLVELFEEKRLGDDVECEFCQAVLQHLKDLIVSNTTKEELKEVLLAICSQLGSYAQQCKDTVNDYLDTIYNFLVNEFDPKVICTAVGLCDGNSSVSQFLPMAKLTPAISEDESYPQLQSNDINGVPFIRRNDKKFVKVKLPFSKPAKTLTPAFKTLPTNREDLKSYRKLTSKPVCALCEYALHELQNILMENKTEEAIKKAVERVCDVLPQTLNNQCKAFIEEYGDALITLLAQEMDPSIICVELKLCGNNSMHVMTKFPSSKLTAAIPAVKIQPADYQLPAERLMPGMLMRPLAKQKNDEICQLCEFVMGMLKMMLGDNKTREAIENALNQVCNELPTAYQQQCREFVDKYADELIDLLEKEDPTTICSILGLCQQMKLPISSTTAAKELKMDECDACQVIVNYIDNFLEDNDIEQDVTNVIEKVCSIVPKSLREQCQSYIETYGPYIMQMLAELLDGKTVCTAIDLCSHTPGEVHLLGGKKCTFGPAYWCKSVQHARSCNAEEHCKKFVWKN